MMERLVYSSPYLAVDIYLQLKDLLLEAELKILFPLPIPLMVLRFGLQFLLLIFSSSMFPTKMWIYNPLPTILL